MCVQQCLEVEVVWIVEYDCIVGFQQQVVYEVECVCVVVGQYDLCGFCVDVVLCELLCKLLVQCGQVEWGCIVGQCIGFVV